MRRHSPGQHPSWCGQGHLCSADRGGEHRSHPISAGHGQAVVVATRTQTTTGADRLEIRAVITLPTNQAAAQRAAGLALVRLHRLVCDSNPSKEH
jgi:hypothetical protein